MKFLYIANYLNSAKATIYKLNALSREPVEPVVRDASIVCPSRERALHMFTRRFRRSRVYHRTHSFQKRGSGVRRKFGSICAFVSRHLLPRNCLYPHSASSAFTKISDRIVNVENYVIRYILYCRMAATTGWFVQLVFHHLHLQDFRVCNSECARIFGTLWLD